MRVMMVSKALVMGAYQRKAEEMARLGVDLTVLVPPFWADRRGRQPVEFQYVAGYRLKVVPLHFNGNFHLHFYPTLARELAAVRPQLLHMDEEPYNLATWLGLRAAHRQGSVGTFFTWQNLYRRYPPPFRWFEQANYRRTPAAIAGNQEAAEVLRRKGYQGAISIIPQFGVDPELFRPAPGPTQPTGNRPLRIGYAGGLLPEKGVDLLLHACAGLRGAWELFLVGEGHARPGLQALARRLGIDGRVHFESRLASSAMPQYYRRLDLFVLPSRSTPTWKEQFGRVLIEAMACGVAVIGSDCGEIPHVIGDAGLIFPEGDVAGLRDCLQALLDAPQRRRELAEAGRQRVLERFTMAQIAARTVAHYAALLAPARASNEAPCTSP
ncbi:MAG: glycosyl transferase family 1 [Litorilinea sp.]|nr:MAG: glycosyl transferase family 1 [Litorilinea sp.]